MQVISVANSINIIISPSEAEIMVSAYRELKATHEYDRTLTPQLKVKIDTAIMLIEGVVASVNETPELSQMIYDSQD